LRERKNNHRATITSQVAPTANDRIETDRRWTRSSTHDNFKGRYTQFDSLLRAF